MDQNSSPPGNHSINWSTDNELEIVSISSSSSVSMSTNENFISEIGESSSRPSNLVHFIKMGFPEALVTKVISELGENNIDAILDTLLTYSSVDEISHQEVEPNVLCLKPKSNFKSDFIDLDSNSSDENIHESFEKDDPLVCLIDMGYSPQEAETAIIRCGKDTPLSELVDFISAAHISKEADTELDLAFSIGALASSSHPLPKDRKKSQKENSFWSKNKKFGRKPQRSREEDENVLHLPKPMIGFGVPCKPFQEVHRTLPDDAIGPPYFYYENVALTPKGVWSTIKRFLYEIEPEFVDSKFFCAAARKRGYIHNLPLENRFPIQPLPKRTIFEALPETKEWWPLWDKREQLNCILTHIGSAQLTDQIRLALETSNGEPSLEVKKYIIGQCKRWNMVWTGKTRVAPLEPKEIELIMGYPINHTRGASRVERYKGLGNAFQVDTVAYHLSVLKKLYPHGINVLSLFTGIGGAEVALHRLGIPMKNVVSVEKSVVCRDILQGWWEETNQTGNLIHMSDIQEVTLDKLKGWIGCFGGFDLVIGGSPCNNLAGRNRRTRDGLEGEHSSLFYDYFRILDAVKSIMGTS